MLKLLYDWTSNLVSMSVFPEAATRGVLLKSFKIFAIFTVKHLCWNLFLIKLQAVSPATLLKGDSSTGAFL